LKDTYWNWNNNWLEPMLLEWKHKIEGKMNWYITKLAPSTTKAFVVLLNNHMIIKLNSHTWFTPQMNTIKLKVETTYDHFFFLWKTLKSIWTRVLSCLNVKRYMWVSWSICHFDSFNLTKYKIVVASSIELSIL